jgi:signal transduction histidine kinase
MEARNQGITVEHRTGQGSGLAVAWETAIETAVHELCRNAEAAMPQGGRIVVTSDFVMEKVERGSVCGGRVNAGLYARITVSDSGPGIPPELRWSALNPFVTGAAAAEKRRGAGMGLSLVCAIARDHGGHLDIECGKGSGTTVAISIPVAPNRGAL